MSPGSSLSLIAESSTTTAANVYRYFPVGNNPRDEVKGSDSILVLMVGGSYRA